MESAHQYEPFAQKSIVLDTATETSRDADSAYLTGAGEAARQSPTWADELRLRHWGFELVLCVVSLASFLSQSIFLIELPIGRFYLTNNDSHHPCATQVRRKASRISPVKYHAQCLPRLFHYSSQGRAPSPTHGGGESMEVESIPIQPQREALDGLPST